MVEPSGFYTRLASRTGFNTSVRHINRTLDLLDSCGPKRNIADEINRGLADKEFDAEEVQAAVNMLLVEKWKYSAVTRNISSVALDASGLVAEVSRWKAVDMVIGYHHPDMGFIVINPKNPESAAVISGFRRNELVVIYAGSENRNAAAEKNINLAISSLFTLVEGGSVKAPASLLSGPYTFQAPKKAAAKKAAVRTKTVVARSVPAYAATAPAPSASETQTAAPAPEAVTRAPPPAVPAVPGRSKMSAMVSVVVSNELFHNGNVEAWKRIIRSYNAKYPNLQVFIYYDGERIVDINTLFKWGKVKHGSCIQFSVAGENIQDLAKLSRYFRQGASPQFEAFLHGSPDTVMNLF